MALDCLTARGRAFVAAQQATARRLAEVWGASLVETPEGTAARVDALFARDNVLVGLAEIKVRSLTLARLEAFGDYLVTEDKLLAGAALSAALRVPFVLAVRLSDAIVWWRVTDATGRRVIQWQARETVTQASCNGGAALRRNAYLPLDSLERIAA